MPRVSKEVEYLGQVYKSAQEMADKLGISKSFAYKLVKLQRPFEPYKPGEKPRSRGGRHARQPVASGPFSWPSQRAAAKDLGTTEGYLYRLLNEGRLDKYVQKKKGVPNVC